MDNNNKDLYPGAFERDIKDRIEMIFENFTLEQVMEMNDLTEQEVIFLLYSEGHISEPNAYFP